MAFGTFTGHCYGPIEYREADAPDNAPFARLRFGVSRNKRVGDEWQTANQFSVSVAFWRNTDRDGNPYPPSMHLKKASLARKGTAVTIVCDFDVEAYDGQHGATPQVNVVRLHSLDLNVSMKDREVEIPGWGDDSPADDLEGEDLPW